MTVFSGKEISAKVYTKDPNMVSRKIAGEMVLVPVRAEASELGSIYSMNAVGARIWELLDGEKTVAQVRDTIVSEYEVEAEVAEADILEFLAELENMSAVTTA